MLAFPSPAGNYPAAADTAARLARRVDEQNARMVDAIERGIAEGSIRPIDAREAATILWASWNGIISLAWRQDELHRDERGLRELLELAADVVSWGATPGIRSGLIRLIWSRDGWPFHNRDGAGA